MAATRLTHHAVLDVRDAGRLDGPDLLELHLRVPAIGEQASAVTEQHRNDVELELVQQCRRKVLLPSGFSSLWFGPATKPSSEIER
jgi:hypothetical protein